MVWWGAFLVALGSPWGWVTIVCPLLMLYFLLNVTGIPLTEEYAVKSKGDAYREYQRTTSKFIPWFPDRRAIANAAAKGLMVMIAIAATSAAMPHETHAQGTGTIVGQVVVIGRGDPVRGARVVVSGTSLTVTSDSAGRFVLRGVEAGIRRVVPGLPDPHLPSASRTAADWPG